MLLLVDASNLWMRAWHATRHESMTAGDESTASLVVFANTLLRHIREEKPDRVAVCWDGGKSVYRSRLLPSYKANRTAGTSDRAKAERRLIKRFLSLAGVFQVERPGVEADDLIAKYWHDAEEDVVLVSEDKDFLQLVGTTPQDHECTVLRSTGERWGVAEVVQKMDASPMELPYVMALTGDTSDNVPGVPGIGPKKAVQLLREAGWLFGAIEHPDVRERAPKVMLSYVLVNLRLPLPGLELPAPPPFEPTGRTSALYDDLLAFLEEYRLKGLIARALSGTLWVDGSEDD